MSARVPTLETPRLKLRPHRVEDFVPLASMWAIPSVTRYTIGKPSTEQQSWGRLMTYVGHWNLLGFGYWAVEEKSSGQFIGDLGFADFKRELTPSIRGVPELGWVLDPQFHGKGYATEALLAALNWGDTHFKRARTVCMIDPANAPSLRVAEKGGFKEYARTTYNGEPTILFERIP